MHVRACSGRRSSSMFASTTSMVSRTSVDGLLEVDDAGQGAGRGAEDLGGDRDRRRGGGRRRARGTRRRSRWMPAWTIIPTQERSSAGSSRNQGISRSMRAIAAVLSAPTARCSCVGRPASRAPSRVASRRRALAAPGMPRAGSRTARHASRLSWALPDGRRVEPDSSTGIDAGCRTAAPRRRSSSPSTAPPGLREGRLGAGAAAPARPRLRPHDLGAGDRARWPGATPSSPRTCWATGSRTSRAPTTASAATPTACATC